MFTKLKAAYANDPKFVLDALAIISFCVAMAAVMVAIIELDDPSSVKVMICEVLLFVLVGATIVFGRDFLKEIRDDLN